MIYTETLRYLQRLLDVAADDERQCSRWSWVRRRAQERLWQASMHVEEFVRSRQVELVKEAVERARVGSPQRRSWHSPSVEQVRDSLPAALRSRFPDGMIQRQIYADTHLPRLDPKVKAVVEQTTMQVPVDEYRRWADLTNVSRPHERGAGWYSLRSIVGLSLPRLSEPVYVWRGEHGVSGDPSFASAVHEARTGDALPRGEWPLSVSIDPDVAARREFTWIDADPKSRESESGWVLQILVDEMIYLGTRDKVLDCHNALADDEKEGLIRATQLVVVDHREYLFDGYWGDRVVHVIRCDGRQT